MQVGNSSSVAQRMTSGRQQGSVALQNSPSCLSVHVPQMSASVVQMPVDSLQQPSQQSASAVQVPEPTGTHRAPPGQHRSAPPADGSGLHVPQQQMSPMTHEAPSSRQQSVVLPSGPGRQSMLGKVSVQHMSVAGSQVRPGRMQSSPGRPPRHRSMPVRVGSQPYRPPPFGQQLELAPPTHTSPAGRHEPSFVQRRISRPSAVVPRTAHRPEQHCASEVQSSLRMRQPPRYWQRGVPVPAGSRQADEQHEPPLTPSGEHGSPAVAQLPRKMQVPVPPPGRSQIPLQHCASSVHSSRAARQAGLVPQEQPMPGPAQVLPSSATHVALQQSAAAPHGAPSSPQPTTAAHAPPVHSKPVQHSAASAHAAPESPQPSSAHAPSTQLPVQHSVSTSHPTPVALHATQEPASQLRVQQSSSRVQLAPSPAQMRA